MDISWHSRVRIYVDVPSGPIKKTNAAKKERQIVSKSNNNKIMVPNAREAMNKFKMEAANEEDVTAPY